MTSAGENHQHVLVVAVEVVVVVVVVVNHCFASLFSTHGLK